MNSPRDLRRRIKSVSGTAQITKAMQMVAASKMRKAQLAATTSAPFARLLYRIQRSATARTRDFSHPLLDGASGPQARDHPGRRRQGALRGAEHERVPGRVAVRSGLDGLHHRRTQGRAVRRADPPAAGRRVPLRRLADLRRGPGDRRVRPRPVPEGGGGRGADRRDAVHQHADAGAGDDRVPADRQIRACKVPVGVGGGGLGGSSRHRVRAERPKRCWGI